MAIFPRLRALLGASLMLLASVPGWAEQGELKPFILAAKTSGDVAAVTADTKQKLGAAGFEVVGEYSPYDGASIVIVTNDALKANAAASEFGAYGAAQRVSVTRVGDEIQVTYTNPVYMSHAYRMQGDLADVRSQLAKALGDQGQFGPEQGLTPKQLREYHYKIFMPYFDDPFKLAVHKDHQTALAAVEAGLASGKNGASKVYRIDIPGKEETLFGVSLKATGEKDKDIDESFVMSEIDFKPLRSTAHLPYDMIVSGQVVYTLSPKFRIAINFPDLSMMGDNSFMNIMGTPEATRTALEQVAEGK
jgi:hypothetical protein